MSALHEYIMRVTYQNHKSRYETKDTDKNILEDHTLFFFREYNIANFYPIYSIYLF